MLHRMLICHSDTTRWYYIAPRIMTPLTQLTSVMAAMRIGEPCFVAPLHSFGQNRLFDVIIGRYSAPLRVSLCAPPLRLS